MKKSFFCFWFWSNSARTYIPLLSLQHFLFLSLPPFSFSSPLSFFLLPSFSFSSPLSFFLFPSFSFSSPLSLFLVPSFSLTLPIYFHSFSLAPFSLCLAAYLYPFLSFFFFISLFLSLYFYISNPPSLSLSFQLTSLFLFFSLFLSLSLSPFLSLLFLVLSFSLLLISSHLSLSHTHSLSRPLLSFFKSSLHSIFPSFRSTCISTITTIEKSFSLTILLVLLF